ncbi:DUF4178 domain-containing protein [Corallococcus exiguus]|uniref:DUF4178 domain-containing protein n=1 Tax=Corallococcus TaxID=83461 RepID=UPI000EC07CB7|nr:DUF4178 domain-containing protein [Corallococcus sp. AB032C]NNB87701.1 DUF4178 domain-containing protein [Corallococcus exiguus]NNB95236.1 DUF4178 domain-containing protein [Corallococcus exiguus]NPC47802.1 DUF4178 domain-containing protein [Corallococcus exiguus]RKH80885.1 DUF4178 domain-containing protein [Corallococcus sp. AB032C]
MTQGACPSCGASVEFSAGSAQVVVCGHCQTMVARVGAELEDHGRVARIVETDSPLRLGLEGRVNGTSYQIVGHLQKDHGAGPWDEWYVEMADGRTGWLSESEGAFHLLSDAGVEEGIELEHLHPGDRLRLRNRPLVVEERGHGRVVAAEGQLPSDVDPDADSYYVDATGPRGLFVTLDFGRRDRDPEVFLGQRLELKQLGIPAGELRPRVRKAQLQQARCTNCNGPLELRAPDQAMRVACPYCGALMSVTQGKLAFLKLLQKPELPAAIALGQKGTLDGTEWICIGYQERSCVVEGTRYPWMEYLLYNAARGFTWLMESNGHWVFLTPMAAGDASVVPQVSAFYERRRYKAFQSVTAVTDAVVGEFYWKVFQGEKARATEYVAPPYSVNEDATDNEVTYTHGEYLSPEKVRDAFKLKEPLPGPRGIAPSQPNLRRESMMRTLRWSAVWLLGLFALAGLLHARALNARVLDLRVTLPRTATSGSPDAMHFSEPFELLRDGNVRAEIHMSQSLDNSWVGVQGDLVNQDTQDVVSFYEEVSYYHGRDSDGSWSEGGQNGSVFLSSLPKGKYVLRTTTSFDPNLKLTGPSLGPVLSYQVLLTHDTPNESWFVISLVLLLVIPALSFFFAHGFETERWKESNL